MTFSGRCFFTSSYISRYSLDCVSTVPFGFLAEDENSILSFAEAMALFISCFALAAA